MVQHYTFIDPLASERDPGKGPPNQFLGLNQVLRLCPWCVPQDLSSPRVVWGTFVSYSAKKDVGWIWIFPQTFRCAQFGGFMLGMFTSNPFGDSQAISSLNPVLF